MRTFRTFIAVLLALSVVFLPMAASMAAPAPQAATQTGGIDCDHHQHGRALPQKAPPANDHCLAMVDCGLCCVTLTGVGVVLLSQDAGMGTAIEPLRLRGPSLSWLTAPPFRPPRV